MKNLTVGIAAAAMSATGAHAAGLDRSGQNISILFESGRQVELSFGAINPSLSGVDGFSGRSTGGVAKDYTQLSLSYKYDVTDDVSFAMILDQQFGADIFYNYAAAGSFLGGTKAKADAYGITGLLRYKMDSGFSVHGGLRAQQTSGAITLSGLAYGALNGYNVDLADDWGLGYVAGFAYERPEIALRVALTYNSAVNHTFDTVENNLPGPLAILNGVTTQTDIKTPQSVNLDFQTGVAKDTLVFGQIRWVDWESLKLAPRGFGQAAPGSSLINIDNSFTYTLGVGRKFTENWSGAASIVYEKADDPLVSPLSATTGRKGITLAAIYTKDNMKVTTGVNYSLLGDSTPYTGAEIPANIRANFKDNHAVAVGVKIAYKF